ncbi:MAG: RNA-binding protein [Ignavibacteria bacterium]|nr:RNA-binding protein [Ignavibacteria bacterium]
MVTLYVGNLNYKTTEDSIHQLFSKFGEVQSVKFIKDKQTGRFRGFGFVEMESDEAEAAIQELNGSEFDGRSIKVHEAKEKTERQPRSNNYEFGNGRNSHRNY